MGKRNKLSDEQIEKVVRLFTEEKWIVPRIARHFHVTTGCIEYRLLRNGIDPWNPQRRKSKGGGRPFTADEDDLALDLVGTPTPIRHVARAMKRPRTSVLLRVLTLEVRAEAELERAA